MTTTQPRDARARADAHIRAVVTMLPAPGWLTEVGATNEKLAVSISRAFGGSTWKQVERAIKDLRDAEVASKQTTQAVLAAISHISQHLVATGGGAVDASVAAWRGPHITDLPPIPQPTVAQLATYAAACRAVLAPAPLGQAAIQIQQARGQLVAAGGPICPPRIREALGALGQAQHTCEQGADKVSTVDTSLREYGAGALGAAQRSAGRRTH